ncbi:MAG: efflux RND transporter periplasmic adaptor subunit [Pseudomonadota bacterium]
MFNSVRAFSFSVLLALAGQGGAQPPAGSSGGPPAIPVEIASVQQAAVSTDIPAVGTLRANESVMIRPEIAGRVQAIHFEEGAAVRKGDELITLDDSEPRAQLAESSAAVKLNQLNFKRTQEMFAKKLLSQQEYDQAQANLVESQARQNLHEAQLAKTRLRAPFDGVLGLRRVSPGDYLQLGQDVVNLEDISTLKLDFRVPETYLARIKSGQEVTLKVDAYPGKTFNGVIYSIDPRIDEQTRTLQLRARVPNDEILLRPGMFARVAVVLKRTQSLVVPEQALVPKGNEQFVYRVADGKALLIKVQTGQRRAGQVEIVSGLNARDTVVTAGQTKLRDGAPVRVVNAPPAQAD